jgi:hypothetical protein
MLDVKDCPEGLRLRNEYDVALRVWGALEFPTHDAPIETESKRVARLERGFKALLDRNAASQCLVYHQQICPTCGHKRLDMGKLLIMPDQEPSSSKTG